MTALAYRAAIEADIGFVVQSFLDSFRTAHAAGLIAMDDWRAVMEPQWRKILSRPRVEVHVAHHPGETDERANVYGWLAVERRDRPLVLYVYVKHAYRKLGIARGLFTTAGIDPAGEWDYAAKTGVLSKPQLKAKIPRAKWTPLAARFPP